ncbi:ATP synthase subunit I [Cohnella lubricantis]|uniref:ATP synthase subunit I n=1 Tax=Cohnella lubricantis TaxID=2163172 RepID=A0A841T9M9_9BACL|nr:ATP synthase subunit I [Cohnella lubricantis]MBB6676759.1 ATP synthase subunit I [Cohnella lubricantis]MBP2117805.1 ATP synthase protein I [Cohnella lubricantis]
MDELPALLKRVSRIAFFFLSMGCLGWVILPGYKPVFGGFLIGVIGGLAISWHLAWKLVRLGDAAAAGRKPRSGLGFLTRACIGLLAGVVSVRTLEFDLAATAAGLIVPSMATLLLGIIARRRLSDGHPTDERGEKH